MAIPAKRLFLCRLCLCSQVVGHATLGNRFCWDLCKCGLNTELTKNESSGFFFTSISIWQPQSNIKPVQGGVLPPRGPRQWSTWRPLSASVFPSTRWQWPHRGCWSPPPGRGLPSPQSPRGTIKRKFWVKLNDWATWKMYTWGCLNDRNMSYTEFVL